MCPNKFPKNDIIDQLLIEVKNYQNTSYDIILDECLSKLTNIEIENKFA